MTAIKWHQSMRGWCRQGRRLCGWCRYWSGGITADVIRVDWEGLGDLIHWSRVGGHHVDVRNVNYKAGHTRGDVLVTPAGQPMPDATVSVPMGHYLVMWPDGECLALSYAVFHKFFVEVVDG